MSRIPAPKVVFVSDPRLLLWAGRLENSLKQVPRHKPLRLQGKLHLQSPVFDKATTDTRAITSETMLHVLRMGTFLIESSDSYSRLCWNVLSSNIHLVVPIPPFLFSITTFTIQPPPCLNMQSLFLHTCMPFLPYHVTQPNRLFYFSSAATRS